MQGRQTDCNYKTLHDTSVLWQAIKQFFFKVICKNRFNCFFTNSTVLSDIVCAYRNGQKLIISQRMPHKNFNISSLSIHFTRLKVFLCLLIVSQLTVIQYSIALFPRCNISKTSSSEFVNKTKSQHCFIYLFYLMCRYIFLHIL